VQYTSLRCSCVSMERIRGARGGGELASVCMHVPCFSSVVLLTDLSLSLSLDLDLMEINGGEDRSARIGGGRRQGALPPFYRRTRAS
jgi:hypothetical protein